MVSAECVTTGLYTAPSGVTLPAADAAARIHAGMVTALTINGINYLSGGSATQFVSLDASWENNFRPGFFAGSGTQDGFPTQGRFEWGDRSFGIQFVVRVQAGSTEYSDLISTTTGPATITFTCDGSNSMAMTVESMTFRRSSWGARTAS